MFLNIEHRKFGPHNREQCVSVEFSLLMGHLQLSCSPSQDWLFVIPLYEIYDWSEMDGIHPKFVLSKRFPVHAAIEQLNLHALKVRTDHLLVDNTQLMFRTFWLQSQTPGFTSAGSWPTRTSQCCTRPAPTDPTASRPSWTSWSSASLWELPSTISTVSGKLHCSMLSGMFW